MWAVGRTLPDVEEGTMFGTPALKVRGTWFACIPTNRSAEPGSLAIRVDFEQRDELIAAEPETYYVKDHYAAYPCVLVRLARINHDEFLPLCHTMSLSSVSSNITRRAPTSSAFCSNS